MIRMTGMTSKLAAWAFVALAAACNGDKEPPAGPPAVNTAPVANPTPVATPTPEAPKQQPEAPKQQPEIAGFGSDPLPADDSDVLGPGPAPTAPKVDKSGLYKPGNAGAAADGRDKAAIHRVIRAGLQQIRGCYEKALTTRPTLAGTTDVSFAIAPDGAVTSATGSGFDPEVDACVAGAVKALKFPAGDAETKVNYPFIFKSE